MDSFCIKLHSRVHFWSSLNVFHAVTDAAPGRAGLNPQDVYGVLSTTRSALQVSFHCTALLADVGIATIFLQTPRA